VAGPRLIVDVPPLSVLPYGLLSVVEPLPITSPHWQNGVTWRAMCEDLKVTYDECIAVTGSGGPPPDPPLKTTGLTSSLRGATPFTVYAEFTCSPVGPIDAAAAAQGALSRKAPYAVERAFWTGLAENNAAVVYPHLAAPASVVDSNGVTLQSVPVTGGPFKPGDALGFVEATLAACTNSIGVIHIPRRVIPDYAIYLRSAGGRLYTTGGNLVAAGSGYLGTSPSGGAPTTSQSWIYGTNQVFEIDSDVAITGERDSIDRSSNTINMIAERTYLLGWDCCHVGALVDTSGV
jgi:hypothetical protein